MALSKRGSWGAVFGAFVAGAGVAAIGVVTPDWIRAEADTETRLLIVVAYSAAIAFVGALIDTSGPESARRTLAVRLCTVAATTSAFIGSLVALGGLQNHINGFFIFIAVAALVGALLAILARAIAQSVKGD